MYLVKFNNRLERFTDLLDAFLFALPKTGWKLFYKVANQPAKLLAYSGEL